MVRMKQQQLQQEQMQEEPPAQDNIEEFVSLLGIVAMSFQQHGITVFKYNLELLNDLHLKCRLYHQVSLPTIMAVFIFYSALPLSLLHPNHPQQTHPIGHPHRSISANAY